MRYATFVVAALLAVGLAACGGGAAPAPADPTVALDLKEFAFTPKEIEIPAGQKVTLELKNSGTVEHDLAIDALDLKVVLKPGRTATRVVGPFTAGTTFDVYCSVAGHKESGMTGKLVVK